MTTPAELLVAVEESPRGPTVAAFFDLDGTLIRGYSAEPVYRDRLRRLDIGPEELARTVGAALDMRLRGSDLDGLMAVAIGWLAGREHQELEELGERLFREQIASAIFPEARALVAAHRRRGHRVVLTTSATPYQSEPLARDLEMDAVLCTRPELRDGWLTGEIDGELLWGPGKADAVREYAAAEGMALEQSYAYTNGAEDLALLEAVGRPCALNPDYDLAEEAEGRGWPAARFEDPQRGFSVGSAVRTGAALGALAASVVVGGAVGVLTRSRRTASNVVAGIGPDLALALGGVRLRITGEENLWTQRPAVFMFNHQSGLDMLVIGSLVRRDAAGVAKKEASRDPRFAPIGLVVDVAYVDRSNSSQARAAMEPAVEKLRGGTSLVIAPEGTRSPTPKLGRFKKGGFHMAMQAGVPVVPVVIRNSGDRMWRDSFFLHPGEVEVAVLPPVPTAGWDPDEIDGHVAEVRDMFARTLEDWPG